MRKKLYADLRSGCCAIYHEDRKNDTNGCHSDDERNIAFSSKLAKYGGHHWDMCEETQQLFSEMVAAYNEKYNL